MVIKIKTALGAESQWISDFFRSDAIGYYIPAFQREYSWRKDNVQQLLEDLCNGVNFLVEAEGNESELHYLGIMIVLESIKLDKEESEAQPYRIDSIIDGQQRISTIAMLAALLHLCIHSHKIRLQALRDSRYAEVINSIDKHKDALWKVFTVNFHSGDPKYKPKLIRSMVDSWTFEGMDTYQSPLTKFLAQMIDLAIEGQDQDADVRTQITFDTKNPVGANAQEIFRYIKQIEQVSSSNGEDRSSKRRC